TSPTQELLAFVEGALLVGAATAVAVLHSAIWGGIIAAGVVVVTGFLARARTANDARVKAEVQRIVHEKREQWERAVKEDGQRQLHAFNQAWNPMTILERLHLHLDAVEIHPDFPHPEMWLTLDLRAPVARRIRLSFTGGVLTIGIG